MAYDDPRFGGIIQSLSMAKAADAAIGSANVARVELQRKTFMKNVTVKDFNIEVITGATCTGTSQVLTQIYQLGIGKALGGTGDVSILGTALVGTAGAADGSVLDGVLAETNFVAGDDIVFSVEIGTALGDNSLIARANVSYVERYVGS